MKPELFHKLIEKNLIAPSTPIAVEYHLYEDGKKRSTVKGMYTIESLSSHPFFPGVQIIASNDKETVTVEYQHIKLISGITPNALAAQHGLRPDGKSDDAPKRRGRKPKDRSTEAEWSL